MAFGNTWFSEITRERSLHYCFRKREFILIDGSIYTFIQYFPFDASESVVMKYWKQAHAISTIDSFVSLRIIIILISFCNLNPIQFQYVAVNSFALAQSNSLNVQESPPPVGVSVDAPAKMIFYINGAGQVRALLPIDITVLTMRHFRDQMPMTPTAPIQTGAYGQPRLPYRPPTDAYQQWIPQPFPRLPSNIPRPQVAPYNQNYNDNRLYPYNDNIPSRVGKKNVFQIFFAANKSSILFANSMCEWQIHTIV